mmetsp:Transcript_26139/g.54462  ORF Transcript_26139/g.54462 Transcript_26139/m.54462 type:complete len:235 (-) Transcript_26139:141-845(-)
MPTLLAIRFWDKSRKLKPAKNSRPVTVLSLLLDRFNLLRSMHLSRPQMRMRLLQLTSRLSSVAGRWLSPPVANRTRRLFETSKCLRWGSADSAGVFKECSWLYDKSRLTRFSSVTTFRPGGKMMLVRPNRARVRWLRSGGSAVDGGKFDCSYRSGSESVGGMLAGLCSEAGEPETSPPLDPLSSKAPDHSFLRFSPLGTLWVLRFRIPGLFAEPPLPVRCARRDMISLMTCGSV